MALRVFRITTAVAALGLGLAACDRGPMPRAEAAPEQQRQERPPSRGQEPSHEGEASYYGREFSGRQMANGERFDPNSDSAAHRRLPLGTTALVTNLQNGRSATVKVKDRGPYAKNRVIDLSPRTADELGMKQAGTAPVRVTPIEVPERGARRGRDPDRQAQR